MSSTIVKTGKLYGLDYKIVHIDRSFQTWFNGYIVVPDWCSRIPTDGVSSKAPRIRCHGGITYSEVEDDGRHWIGFDTAHGWETSEERSVDYIENELRSIACQLLIDDNPEPEVLTERVMR